MLQRLKCCHYGKNEPPLIFMVQETHTKLTKHVKINKLELHQRNFWILCKSLKWGMKWLHKGRDKAQKMRMLGWGNRCHILVLQPVIKIDKYFAAPLSLPTPNIIKTCHWASLSACTPPASFHDFLPNINILSNAGTLFSAIHEQTAINGSKASD